MTSPSRLARRVKNELQGWGRFTQCQSLMTPRLYNLSPIIGGFETFHGGIILTKTPPDHKGHLLRAMFVNLFCGSRPIIPRLLPPFLSAPSKTTSIIPFHFKVDFSTFFSGRRAGFKAEHRELHSITTGLQPSCTEQVETLTKPLSHERRGMTFSWLSPTSSFPKIKNNTDC